jgi:hypothetical protein
MAKFITAALVTAAVLTAASAANAWVDPWGFVHPPICIYYPYYGTICG